MGKDPTLHPSSTAISSIFSTSPTGINSLLARLILRPEATSNQAKVQLKKVRFSFIASQNMIASLAKSKWDTFNPLLPPPPPKAYNLKWTPHPQPFLKVHLALPFPTQKGKEKESLLDAAPWCLRRSLQGPYWLEQRTWQLRYSSRSTPSTEAQSPSYAKPS